MAKSELVINIAGNYGVDEGISFSCVEQPDPQLEARRYRWVTLRQEQMRLARLPWLKDGDFALEYEVLRLHGRAPVAAFLSVLRDRVMRAVHVVTQWPARVQARRRGYYFHKRVT